MKKLSFMVIFLFSLFVISGCNFQISKNITSTPSVPPTDPPTPTASFTSTPTLPPTPTITPTKTEVPALQTLIDLAKEQKMLISISFSPGITVDPYFDEVQVVEGYTPEQLVGQSYPEIWGKVQNETYYKNYFRVILVGDFNRCYGNICDDLPIYMFGYTFKGRDMLNMLTSPPEGVDYEEWMKKIEYGGVVIQWHVDENIYCLAGSFVNACAEGYVSPTATASPTPEPVTP